MQAFLPPSEPVLAQPGPRGRPATFALRHLWLGLLVGLLRGFTSYAQLWRLLVWQGLGTLPLLQVGPAAVRQRLLRAGLEPLQSLLEHVSQTLWLWTSRWADRDLAPFAREVVVLDETTLDAVQRLCQDVAQEPAGSPRLLVGKLAGLFDVRRQHWRHLQFRQDVYANCKAGAFLLLDGLPPASLILADLGYFGFAWFDYLSQQGSYWLSRLREKTSYELVHVFYRQGQVLDALVWLGASRADRAAHLVRLIQYPHGGQLHRYVTNVHDPLLLSLQDAAQLYARRWDIEMGFRLLKEYLGLRLWWGCQPTLVLQQLWLSLILAQIVHALHGCIAARAGVPLEQVSLPILLNLLAQAPQRPLDQPLIPLLVQQGRFLRLIRPSRRIQPCVPAVLTPCTPAPASLPLTRPPRYARRKCQPRSERIPFIPRFRTQLLL